MGVKNYYKEEDIPLFLGMECYFSAPFVGYFNEQYKSYYIIIPNKRGTYYFCSFNQELDNGFANGEVYVHDDNTEYQADEYEFDNLEDLEEHLIKHYFEAEWWQTWKKKILKMNKKLKIQEEKKLHEIEVKNNTIKYLVMQPVYHIDYASIQEKDGWLTQEEMPALNRAYINIGEVVTLDDGCYVTEDGRDVPIEHCTVLQLMTAANYDNSIKN